MNVMAEGATSVNPADPIFSEVSRSFTLTVYTTSVSVLGLTIVVWLGVILSSAWSVAA